MKKKLIGLFFVCLASASFAANAQQAAQPQQQAQSLTINSLIQAGFEIKAVTAVNGAFVFALQRDQTAFVCEADTLGVTKLCIAIR